MGECKLHVIPDSEYVVYDVKRKRDRDDCVENGVFTFHVWFCLGRDVCCCGNAVFTVCPKGWGNARDVGNVFGADGVGETTQVKFYPPGEDGVQHMGWLLVSRGVN